MIKLYMIQIKVSKINVIKMSVIMLINWIFIFIVFKPINGIKMNVIVMMNLILIFILLNQTHLSHLDHSSFFCMTILHQLRSLEYIRYQNQGYLKLIKINIIKIKIIKINFEMCDMNVIKLL